jgi:hypothetical protein
MNNYFIRENITLVSVIIFITIFVLVQMSKPRFLFNTDGTPREFGIGYKNKTIFPIWLFSIVLGILSYFSVMCYAKYYK